MKLILLLGIASALLILETLRVSNYLILPRMPPTKWLEFFDEQKVSLLPPQFYILATLAG